MIDYTSKFAKKFDFDIKPISFIEEFTKSGILFFDNNLLRIAIPFIESYLLAQELAYRPKLAVQYFDLDDYSFDLAAFDLYCEIQPCDQIVSAVAQLLERNIERSDVKQHILLSNRIDSSSLIASKKLRTLQDQIDQTAKDIHDDKNTTAEKQRFLDISERVSKETRKSSVAAFETDDDDSGSAKYDTNSNWKDFKSAVEKISKLSFATMVGTLLVGYGAEHLDASTKRKLVVLVARNASQTIDQWTEFNDKIDFESMKRELTSKESIDTMLNKYPSDIKPAKLISTIEDFLAFMKFVNVSDPFRKVMGRIGEHAKNPILGKSLDATNAGDQFPELIRAIWLSDLELGYGEDLLIEKTKSLPKTSLLRICVSEYLLKQVYWRHIKKNHRLKLLDIAEKILKKVSVSIDSLNIKKVIKGEKKDEV